MGREANIRSIRALEKQIKEGDGDIIQLKRARNSLLNISTRVPPEILGKIFIWKLSRSECRSMKGFDGLQKGSYNFILVCHHWFEVASHTPELWSFWGNTLQDWKKRHTRSGVAPLDLVLLGRQSFVSFDGPLQDAVRSRVMQGTIRQVHLDSVDNATVARIISLLTPDNEGSQNENIESIILRHNNFFSVDCSTFFTRSRLSKLRFLYLEGDSRIITASQLFPILASNPNLRELRLSYKTLPNDTEESALQVSLPNLKRLYLEGKFRHLFGLLHRLVLPGALDDMYLSTRDSTLEDITQTLVPYMRDYFRRDARFRDRLDVSYISALCSGSIVVSGLGPQTTEPTRTELRVILPHPLPPDVQEQLFVDLVALTPREHVVSFSADYELNPLEELFSAMPGLETLSLGNVELSEGFLQPNPDGPRANTKLLPSLRSLHLFLSEYVDLGDGDWGHLATYLAHQTSEGQLISLEVSNAPHIPPEVEDKIRGLVEEFTCYHILEAGGGWSPS